MSERMQLIADYLSEDYGISELAVAYGVSRKTVYKWVGRYEAGGPAGLEDLSRAPRHHPNAVSAEIVREVLRLKGGKPRWGAPKLRRKLLAVVGVERCPAESTVSEILRQHGLSGQSKRRRRRAVASAQPMSHCQEVNRVWCVDFKGWFYTGDGRRCTPLTMTDGYSRYLLCCQGLGEETGGLVVQPLFIKTFREYGLPEAIRSDNGPPFASLGLGGLTALSVWWVRLGIGLERIEPGCPQQNGRHERMHRTLKAETASPPQANGRAQQRVFDAFRREYNEERPHEALGQEPPASVYRPSPRPYPERLPEQRGYPDDWEKRQVRQSGQIKWRGRDISVSMALWGQEVGLKPAGEGLWRIYFEHLELGTFDERKGRVLPLRRLPAIKAAPAQPLESQIQG